MKTIPGRVLTGLCAAATLAVASAAAQSPDVKEKAPMYTYVANWTIPRAKWAAMEKENATTDKTLDHDLTAGALLGYGDDVNLVHTAEGATHDGWWSGKSLAAVLGVLDEFYKAGSVASAALESATKHWDGLYISRFYNWRAGSYKGAYTRVSAYKLRADAPADAVETIAKAFAVPLLEKLLADGAVVEYEIDEESIHTESPDMFWIEFITPNAEGLDKANAELREALRASPFFAPAFHSMVDYSQHRDYLLRTDATYK